MTCLVGGRCTRADPPRRWSSSPPPLEEEEEEELGSRRELLARDGDDDAAADNDVCPAAVGADGDALRLRRIAVGWASPPPPSELLAASPESLSSSASMTTGRRFEADAVAEVAPTATPRGVPPMSSSSLLLSAIAA